MRWLVGILGLAAVALAAVIYVKPGLVMPYLPPAVAQFAGLDKQPDRSAGPSKRERRATPIQAQNVSQMTARDTFATTGEVVARDNVTIAGEQAGRVAQVLASDGERVAKGAVIVRLDTGDAQARLAAAESALREASNNLSRQNKLANRDYAADATVEDARAKVSSAKADVTRAQERLNNLTVRAPFAGAIGFIAVSPGDFVQPGQRIADMASVQDLRARFEVPTDVAAGVKTGDMVQIRGLANARQSQAEVISISPLASSAARSVTIEAQLTGKDIAAKPGTFLDVAVVTSARPDALFISEAAVLRQGPLSSVFVLERAGDQTVVRQVTVELGVRQDGLIEIRSDKLSSATKLVVGGLQKISDGSKVRVEAAEEQAEKASKTGRADDDNTASDKPRS